MDHDVQRQGEDSPTQADSVGQQLGWLAQALAYGLGERVWLAGRERAQHQAGEVRKKLDLRAFHNRGIGLGSVGLDLLTRELD